MLVLLNTDKYFMIVRIIGKYPILNIRIHIHVDRPIYIKKSIARLIIRKFVQYKLRLLMFYYNMYR